MMDTPFLNLKSCKIIKNLSNKIRCFISKCNKLICAADLCLLQIKKNLFITNKKN